MFFIPTPPPPHPRHKTPTPPGFTLTVDVFILSNQVRVSPLLSLSALQLWDLSSQNKARGAQSKVWLFKCRGGLGTTAWAVKCVSEEEVTAAASGQNRAHGVSVSHPE